MQNFDENLLQKKINSETLFEKGVDLKILKKTVKREGSLYFYILDHFGSDISSSKVTQNEAYKMSKALSNEENDSLSHSKRHHGTVSDG